MNKKKNKLKKPKNSNKIDSDTHNFLKGFKNSKISQKTSRKSQDISQQRPNLGPFVQKASQKLQIDQNLSVDYPCYTVKNHTVQLNAEEIESTNKYKLLVPKEKVIQKNSKTLNTFEKCCLCNFASNELNGIGDLFGPYLININKNELDISNTDLNNDDEKNLDIFIHEGCAIWSSEVFAKDNKIYGLDKTFSIANEFNCFCCKKKGATLICKVNSCGKMFHYPCAVQKEVAFFKNDFTIKCKAHHI
ncbi:unnamed protein product [Brachionus calyciflorus]|uniref:PHD-type domain-containing protein n=1 Tax=Brachionus calyciflorus TaxID=104777 RepID=A0A813M3J8_9BILA|nr:unnamed protein product [Brachionus calyciflorus]